MLVHLQDFTPFEKTCYDVINFITNIPRFWIILFFVLFVIPFTLLFGLWAYVVANDPQQFHKKQAFIFSLTFITFVAIAYPVSSLGSIKALASATSIEEVVKTDTKARVDATMPKSFATPQRLKSPFAIYYEEKDGKKVFLNQFPTTVTTHDKMMLQLNGLKIQEVSFDLPKDEALSKFTDAMISSGTDNHFDIVAVKSSSNHTTIKYALLKD